MASFSESVKEELLRELPQKPCCMLSELSAMTQHGGSLVLRGGGKVLLRFHVSSTALAKRALLLLKRRANTVPQIQFREEAAFGKHRAVMLSVDENDTRRLLILLHMLDPAQQGFALQRMPRGTMTRRCCQRSYLRAMFLLCGTVRDPSAGYTMEFTFPDEEASRGLQRILERQQLPFALRRRAGHTVVYLTRGEAVADALAMMGAPVSRLAFESQRITRASSARAVRATNCDSANLSRQLNASAELMERLERYMGEHPDAELPPRLQETARLRLSHPEASVEELGQLFSRPLSKSGAFHRLEKLGEWLREQEP